MGISSLGVGSSILTQDILDQLREADESGKITPITLSIANENDKKNALEVVDATMTNLIDSISALKDISLYDERSSDVTGTAVEVTASANTDLQDFSLEVTQLATKQIEQSGAFTLSTESIGATDAGSVNLNIDGQDFAIAYDTSTTLDDFKKSINDIAGDKVDATIVQIDSGEFRLFVSSVDTGTTQDITMTDADGFLGTDTRLTSDVDVLTLGMEADGITPITSDGLDASFTFNGQAITRTSNEVSDLIVGLDITLKEVGTSNVSIAQNRENIIEKFDSFVEKYNSAVTELERVTKVSTEAEDRGIFSGESTIKGMQSAIKDIISSVGGGVGSMFDFGFDIDADGKISLDKTVLNEAMDSDAANVEAFFSGGTYTDANLNTTVVTGALNEIATKVEEYTSYNATLDQYKTSVTDRISDLEDRKLTATERLDAKYEIMKKRYAAFDLMISKITSASSMFVQMANAQTAAQN